MWGIIVLAVTIVTKGLSYMKFIESILDFDRTKRIKDRVSGLLDAIPPVRWFVALTRGAASRVDKAVAVFDTGASSAEEDDNDDDSDRDDTNDNGAGVSAAPKTTLTTLRKRDLHYRTGVPRRVKPKSTTGPRLRRMIIYCAILYVVAQVCMALINFYLAFDQHKTTAVFHETALANCNANPSLWSDPQAHCAESDDWMRVPRYAPIAGINGVLSGFRVFLFYGAPSVTLRDCVIVGIVLVIIFGSIAVLVNAALSVGRGCMALLGYNEQEIDAAMSDTGITPPSAPPPMTANHTPKPIVCLGLHPSLLQPHTPQPHPEDESSSDSRHTPADDAPPPRTVRAEAHDNDVFQPADHYPAAFGYTNDAPPPRTIHADTRDNDVLQPQPDQYSAAFGYMNDEEFANYLRDVRQSASSPPPTSLMEFGQQVGLRARHTNNQDL
jgi:hypothetical protein